MGIVCIRSLDRMTHWLKFKGGLSVNLDSNPSPQRLLANAQTLSTLWQSDPARLNPANLEFLLVDGRKREMTFSAASTVASNAFRST